MRLYLKLLVMIAIFACASRYQVRQALFDVAYDARVALVLAYGSYADYEKLVDHRHRIVAREQGNLHLYVIAKRYQQLLEQRLAAATAQGLALDGNELMRIETECLQEALGATAD